jgi:hypothetical protein
LAFGPKGTAPVLLSVRAFRSTGVIIRQIAICDRATATGPRGLFLFFHARCGAVEKQLDQSFPIFPTLWL